MYKVFFNEKKLTIDNVCNESEKNILFEDHSTIEMALDLLENTSCKEVNLYADNEDKIWDDFCDFFVNIEAAGGIVENQEGKKLFIYRMGKWDLPKGKLEPNETLESAAVREVEEETGLSGIQLKSFITNTYHIYTEKRINDKVLKTTYWYKMKYEGTEKPVPQTDEGITEVAWLDAEEIRNKVFPNTFNNIQNILGLNQINNFL